MTRKADNLPKKPAKKTEIIKNSPEKQGELMSVTALSRLFDLDRATVRSRIEHIKPAKKTGNETLYEYTEELEDSLRYDELEAAKLQKLQAEAELKEHDLAVKRGEYASVAEFTEVVQKIFGRLYKKMGVQLPGKIAAKLHNANSTAEVAAILKAEIAKEFDGLRSDFTKYL